MPPISPLFAPVERVADLKAEANDLPAWDLTPRQVCELELLLNGSLSPLGGYLDEADYRAVLAGRRLADGRFWPWPVVLDVSAAFAEGLAAGQRVALRDAEGVLVAVLGVASVWQRDPEAEVAALFGDVPAEHAGARFLRSQAGPVLLGGALEGVEPPVHYDFRHLRRDPVDLAREHERRGWHRILAVQTRDMLQRPDQALVQATARELEANVLLQPLAGMAEAGDTRHFARIRGCELALRRFMEQTTELCLLPRAPAFGSVGEELLDLVIASNHGACHLLRPVDPGDAADAAAAAALEAAAAEVADELFIQPVVRERLQWSSGRRAFVTAPADPEPPTTPAEAVQWLEAGHALPDWYTWSEVRDELKLAWPPRHAQGFTLLFTGLSGSGKSTLAQAVTVKLLELGGRRVTLLDGDLVRKHLSSELGFSKEHRELNIRRIGFVASQITKNGGIAVCAPIAPYAATRAQVREMVGAVGGFVEVHVSTPLEVCEARDRKGLYARARAGQIKAFTGISDPYEVPEAPDLRIDTSRMGPDEAAQRVILKLTGLGFLSSGGDADIYSI